VGDQELPRDPTRQKAVKRHHLPAPRIDRSRRTALAAVGTGLTAALFGPAWAQTAPNETPALERIRKVGRISVGVYEANPPFNVKSAGIDVEVAKGIAKGLGLELSLMPFNAGENMDDDLRAMVWKGHYLGFGPADVLLHVPVDAPLMNANPRVSIFAPYYRERLAMARDLKRVPKVDTMADFKGQRIAVPGQSLAGWLLIGSDGGAYREQLDTKMADSTLAAQKLLAGEVAAAAGHSSELESILGGDPRFAIEPLPLPRMRDGWPIGCAVKKESGDLASAIKQVVDGMADRGELKTIFNNAKVAWSKP
jgi:ABC-type amino acid transport substrate-binding protein